MQCHKTFIISQKTANVSSIIGIAIETTTIKVALQILANVEVFLLLPVYTYHPYVALYNCMYVNITIQMTYSHD